MYNYIQYDAPDAGLGYALIVTVRSTTSIWCEWWLKRNTYVYRLIEKEMLAIIIAIVCGYEKFDQYIAS